VFIAAAAAAVLVHGASFRYLPPGWRAFEAPSVLNRTGADAGSYALSWAYRPNPHGWATSIPRNGIVVRVILIRRRAFGSPPTNLCEHTPRLSRPIEHLPLRLPATTADRLEGSPRVLEYRVFGWFRGRYNIDLRVDINSTRPTRALLRTAQAVVSGLRFPRWPRC
jgi:hypothetical protein